MENPEPIVPKNLDPLATEILGKLGVEPGTEEIVLGGGVALAHYCEFRETHDVDAWWTTTQKKATIVTIERVMEQIASAHGFSVQKKEWGDVLSFILCRPSGQRCFAFQIAERSRYLMDPVPSAWGAIQIEHLMDNLASKMSALVKRGAARDFVDIWKVCEQGLVSASDCWAAWLAKNEDADIEEAYSLIRKRLMEIEVRRPLSGILNLAEKEQVSAVRRFFTGPSFHYGRSKHRR